MFVIKLNEINAITSYKNSCEQTYKSESNGCLMRISPLAVWGYKLEPAELYEAVKLQTALTHSNGVAIEACYLYCFAIGILIKTGDAQEAYEQTKK